MKRLVVLILLCVVSAEYTTFKWKSCVTDRTNQAIRVNFFDVSPMPILSPGKLHISFYANVLQRIDLAILDFNLTRQTSLGSSIQMPCIEQIGSCQIGGCGVVDVLTNNRSRNDPFQSLRQIIADIFESIDMFKSCPIHIQHIAITNHTVDIPRLSGSIENFVQGGDYTVKVQVRNPLTGYTVGCIEFESSLRRGLQDGFLFG